ncbi:hypothetical protein THAOC_26454 [Thalassiosira oceanica]|uniref:Uncharacterized protein n=1 Tax=Thalassiosira oceanica TaxID=159749 RepID=K0RYR4_THAOC|nr:hypothetical protein THAOC_26454 [Thalassiosira oceanica]|eukprot:EJK54001.1 hypothetical protein THAOC_26454 [Thalassiosira oceanica]
MRLRFDEDAIRHGFLRLKLVVNAFGRTDAEVVDHRHPVGARHNHDAATGCMRPMPGEDRSGEVAKNHRALKQFEDKTSNYDIGERF